MMAVARVSASVAPAPGASGSTSTAPPALSDATILTCSTPAQLMSKMRQLAVTNPEEFKLLAAEMGSRFQTAASASIGQDALLFAKVAAQFQQAARSGDLEPNEASRKPDRSRSTTAVTSTAPPKEITRACWESPGVQQAFTDALDVLAAATGEA